VSHQHPAVVNFLIPLKGFSAVAQHEQTPKFLENRGTRKIEGIKWCRLR
jgi:hypothetical protein